MKNKPIIFLCLLLFIGALSFTAYNVYADSNASVRNSISPQQAIKPTITAVYLVAKGGGQLTQKDIMQHPEVLVVNTFQDLTKIVNQNKKVEIWIDKNATNLVQKGWLLKEPQKYNLLVVIGYDNSLYSFREQLYLGIHGPYVNWKTTKVANGFSVWLLTESTPNSKTAKDKGYSNEVTVENIFKVTSNYPEPISH